MPSRKTLAAIAALLAVLAGGGTLAVTLTPDDQSAAPPAAVTVHVDGLDPGKAPDRSVTVPAAAVQQAAPTIEDNLNAPPAAAPQSELDDAANAADEIRAAQPALPTAGATAGFAGCRTSFVNNQSSRRGVRPQWQVLHYTVSPNRPGWSDVDAVVALFNRSSAQASSNFVIDSEGHCAYIVPIESKAWTQAAANPFSVSYEIIATGREQHYLEPAGVAKLKSVVREVAKRTGIPLQRGRADGCAPGRPGLMQHADFGVCGGGHVDIKPFTVDQVIAELVAGAGPVNGRAASLRARNHVTHRELRARHCAPADRTRSARCVFLWRRHRAVHAAAKRERVRL